MSDLKRIVIGSDHGGFEMKAFLKNELTKRGIETVDKGCYNTDSVDYPTYGALVAKAVASGEFERGIIVCGSGIGISITANRFNGVRAALCTSEDMGRLSREHNNANVLALGGRTTSNSVVVAILDAWLTTPYEGGRHDRRNALIDEVTGMGS